MANEFSKEEKEAFEELLAGFEDYLVLSKSVSVYSTDQTMMERAGNTIWRPQPYISQSFDGTDQTANFKSYTQLSVPATLGYSKSAPWIMTASELRDALQEKRLSDSAHQKLASDINRAVLDVAALQGSLVVKRTVAASGFDDVALCEALMNEQGVGAFDRYLALSSRDYLGMAGNLASRGTVAGKVSTAYEEAYVGPVCSFKTFKLDYARRLAAAAGGALLTIDTRASASNYYVPKATDTATTGERSNVDNRFQTITISSTTNVAAGDAFTIANINAVHHITKQDTGQLKTFRVVSVPSATTLVITPPIISAQGGSDAELQHQNCVAVATAANAAIVFLNTAAAAANCFWHKDSIEILPGRYAVPADAGAAVIRGSTENGIEIVFQKQYDIKTMQTYFRVDTLFGVVNKNTEMNGIILFSQT